VNCRHEWRYYGKEWNGDLGGIVEVYVCSFCDERRTPLDKEGEPVVERGRYRPKG